MTIITDTKSLEDLCHKLSKEPWITIDTEFLRDRTYYPQLCLVQLAAPQGASGKSEPVAVDPLADGIDLGPLLTLLENENVIKVFHAARQDLEIFYHLMGKVPHPVFDTQVAAMVCGYGDQIGYYKLVESICGKTLDKGAQFTDWSRRPLSSRQLSYALDDVTFLRDVYLKLKSRLEETGRHEWVREEMGVLTSPATYENDPEDAWERIKIKSRKHSVYAVLQQVSAWREREAQRRNQPRSRILKDNVLADIAVHPPESAAELGRVRGLSDDFAKGKQGEQILAAIKAGLAMPKNEVIIPGQKNSMPGDLAPVLEMLKMLLRIQASEHDVAAKLIANGDDLECLAQEDTADIPALKGWRYDVFGKDALALKSGKLGLSLKKGRIVKTPLS